MKCIRPLLLRIACILLALLPCTALSEEARPTVRVGFFAFDGYHMVDENGERSGYGYDFLRLAARYMDVDYQYVGYDCGWDDMLDMLTDGRIDLLTSAQMTDERLEAFAFSKPIGQSSAMLTTRAGNPAILAGEYPTYDGIRIGLLNENSRNEDLERFASEKGFAYTPVYYDLFTELEQALQKGDVDAALTSSLRRTDNERVLNLFETRDFYAIVRKEDTALLRQINGAIDQMNAVEGEWQSTLTNRYYAHLQERDLTFTPEEQALIAQYVSGEKTLVMTASHDRAPYSYVEDGQLKGIILDYFDRLAEYIGIPYELRVPSSREEYQRWRLEGEVNGTMDARIDSLRWVEKNSYSVSAPYTTMRLAMVTRRDFTGQIDRLAVAAAQGLFGLEDGLAPNAERIEVPTRKEAMQAVLDGNADAAVVYLYTAQQFVNQDERGLLTYTMLFEPTYEYCVAFLPSVSHTLSGIFTKAIYAMGEGVFEDIAVEYTSYKAREIDMLTWIQIYPMPAILICACLFALSLLVTLLFERQKAVRLAKKRSAELAAMAEQAEQANRAKSDFLANVSHDIRTPMNAIVGFANLMECNLDDRQRLKEYIRKIRFSSRHLLSLIEDVLDMRRIESNQIQLCGAPLSLTEQMHQAESITRGMADEKNQHFHLEMQPLTHDAVIADSARLRQVLLNLLSNAVKYTQSGGKILFRLEELPCDTEGSACFRFTVADNGCGIAPDLMEHLFEPFARGEASVTNKVQGTGLGMAITKNIVDCMKGDIAVESTVGRGTRFDVTLTLPLASPDELPTPDGDQISIAGMRFLCAEDNALNAEIIEEMLRMKGAECIVYPDGEKLLAAFKAAEPKDFDAVLMDVQMPNMNGLEATRAIRALPNGRDIPIIAMTAGAFIEDKQATKDAGMNAYVSKPISLDAIQKAIMELCCK